MSVVHVLQGYFRSVSSDKVMRCASVCGSSPVSPSKILICQLCLHGNNKITQASPSKAAVYSSC